MSPGTTRQSPTPTPAVHSVGAHTRVQGDNQAYWGRSVAAPSGDAVTGAPPVAQTGRVPAHTASLVPAAPGDEPLLLSLLNRDPVVNLFLIAPVQRGLSESVQAWS